MKKALYECSSCGHLAEKKARQCEKCRNTPQVWTRITRREEASK